MSILHDLFRHVPSAQLVQGSVGEDVPVTGVTDNSRKVSPGFIFVALAGDNFDGHSFFAAAIASGAVALVGEQSLSQLTNAGIAIPVDMPYWRVPRSRQALAHLASAFYGFPSKFLTVIGITGTDGKTTTANLLESILVAATSSPGSQTGKVGVVSTVAARICGEESDTGFHVTTPDAPTIQHYLAKMRRAGCQYAIIECTSQGIAQSRLDAVHFDVAAVTNITHEHLDWHKTRTAYLDAKADLFRKLYQSKPSAQRQCAVLNADDVGTSSHPGSFETIMDVLNTEVTKWGRRISVYCYAMSAPNPNGLHPGGMIWATDIHYRPGYTKFVLNWSGGSIPIETSLVADFNVQNIVCASAIALSLDINPRHIQQGIARLKGVLGRMERIDCGQPFLVLVDFAHSPASLERALMALRQILATEIEEKAVETTSSHRPRLISVFGSAGLRDVAKRRLMGQISGRLADFTIITAEDPRTEELAQINQAIASGVVTTADADSYTIVPDRADAIRFAMKMALPGDIVATFGKGHERSMCYGTTEYPWNEQETVRSALKQAGYSATSQS